MPKSKSQKAPLIRRVSNAVVFALLILITALFLLWDLMVHTTPVGHGGIVWHRFTFDGENSVGPLAEGTHMTWPWDQFYNYDLRLQTYDQAYEAVSSEGLHIEVTMTFRWRVLRMHVVDLNNIVGPDYLQKMLVPVVGSVAREVVSGYTAEEIYSTKRAEVQKAIYEGVVSQDYDNGIVGRGSEHENYELVDLEDTLIKSIVLPPLVKSAIERKLEQSERVEEYAFRLQTERAESERKRIEAEGIRAFQEIVSPAISESYLRWRGIEATLKLAESPNAKVVVIGNSETGLPLILDTGGQDGQQRLSLSSSADRQNLAPKLELPTGTAEIPEPGHEASLEDRKKTDDQAMISSDGSAIETTPLAAPKASAAPQSADKPGP